MSGRSSIASTSAGDRRPQLGDRRELLGVAAVEVADGRDAVVDHLGDRVAEQPQLPVLELGGEPAGSKLSSRIELAQQRRQLDRIARTRSLSGAMRR